MCRYIIIASITIQCNNTLLSAQDFGLQWQYIESLNDENNAVEMNEIWEYYAQNQINLNKASQINLLAQLQLLTKIELEQIQNYCKQTTIKSIYELQTLNIPLRSLKRIKQFITNDTSSGTNRIRKASLYAGIQFQEPAREGTLNKLYKGSSIKTHLRYRQTLNTNWRIGFCIEKDIGEPQIYKAVGINNFAFNILYFGTQHLKKFTIGKYDLTIGEGLLFGTNYRINSPYFLSYTSRAVIKPSLSPKEYKYFNGLTAKWLFNHFSFDVFSSYRRPNGESSYDNTGLFRTATEIKKYKSHKEQLLGFLILREKKNYKITWGAVLYQTDLLKKTDLLQSIYFQRSYYNIQFSSEIANQNMDNWATLQKINIGIGRNSFLTIQFRYREPQMINEFNSDYSSFSNGYEKGIYYAFLHKLSSTWACKLAFDSFISTQLQSKSPHFPKGNKVFTELSREIDNSRFVCHYQFKQIKESNNIQKLRFFYQHQINTNIKWAGKLYWIAENKQWNTSLQHNLFWKSENKKSKVSFSSCYFNTQNEAVYWQAPHFYGTYNARFLSGKGSTYSLSLQKRILTNLKFGAQVTLLNYIDRAQIGTGNEVINSSHKLDFALYIKWKN